MAIFRVRFMLLGDHVHCRVFSAPARDQTFAKLGDLVLSRGTEFRDFVAAFGKADFISDDENIGLIHATENT